MRTTKICSLQKTQNNVSHSGPEPLFTRPVPGRFSVVYMHSAAFQKGTAVVKYE